jgi:hypothetical protein
VVATLIERRRETARCKQRSLSQQKGTHYFLADETFLKNCLADVASSFLIFPDKIERQFKIISMMVPNSKGAGTLL